MAAQVVRNAEEAAVMRRLAEGVREEMMVAMLETLQAAAAACADVCVERLWSLHQGMTRAVEEAEAQQHLAKQPAELLRQRTSLLELLEGSRMEAMEGSAASATVAAANPIVGTGGGSPAAVLPQKPPPQPRDGEISISSDTEEEAGSDHEVLRAVREAEGLHEAEQLEVSEPAAAQDITQAEEYCMADPAEVVRGSCEAMYEDDWTIMSPSQPSEVSVSPPRGGLEGARAACRARRDSRRSAKSDTGSNSPQRNSPQRLSKNTPSRVSLAGFAAEAGADEPPSEEQQRAPPQGSLGVQESSAPTRVQDQEEAEEKFRRPLARALDTELLVNSSSEKLSEPPAATADKASQQLPEEPAAGPCSLDSKGFPADPEEAHASHSQLPKEPTARPASPVLVPPEGKPAGLGTELEHPDAARPEECEHSATALPPAQTEQVPAQGVHGCVAEETEAQEGTRGVAVEAAETEEEIQCPAKSAEALRTVAAELPNGTTGPRLDHAPIEELALAPEEPLQEPPSPGTEVLSDGRKDEDTTASPSPSPSPSPVEPSCQESESELPREALEAELAEPVETTEGREASKTGGPAAADGLASVVATSHELADQQLEEVRAQPTEPALLPPEAGTQFSRKSLSHSTDEVRLRAEDIVGDEASQAAMEVEFEAATQRIAERKRMSSVLEAGENGAKRPTEANDVGESTPASDTKASSGEKQDDASTQLPPASQVKAEAEHEGASTPPRSVTGDEATVMLPEPAEIHVFVQEKNASHEEDGASLVHPEQPQATEEALGVTEELRPDEAGSQEVVLPTQCEEADSLGSGHLTAAAGTVGDNTFPSPSSLENSKPTPAVEPVPANVEARAETLHKESSDTGERGLLLEEPLLSTEAPTEAGAVEGTAAPAGDTGTDSVLPADIEATTLAATQEHQELPESTAAPPPCNTGAWPAADQELDEASDPARGSEHGAVSDAAAGFQSSPTLAVQEVNAAGDDRPTADADDLLGVVKSMAAPQDASEVSGECPLGPVEERNPCALEKPPVETVVEQEKDQLDSQALVPPLDKEIPGSLPVSAPMTVEPESETAQGELSCRQDLDITLEPSGPLHREEAPKDDSPNNGELAEAVPQRAGSAPALPAETETLALEAQSVAPTEGQNVQGVPASLDDQPESSGALGKVSQDESAETGGAAEVISQLQEEPKGLDTEAGSVEPQSASVQGEVSSAVEDVQQPQPLGGLAREVAGEESANNEELAEVIQEPLKESSSSDLAVLAESVVAEPPSGTAEVIQEPLKESSSSDPAVLAESVVAEPPSGTVERAEADARQAPALADSQVDASVAEVMEPQLVTSERGVDFREAPDLAEVQPEPSGNVAQDEPASCSRANAEAVETLGALQPSSSASACPPLFPDANPGLSVPTAAAAGGAVRDPLWPADPVDRPSSSRPLFELDPEPVTAAKSAAASARPAQVKSLFDFDLPSDIRVEPPAPVREQTTTPWTPPGASLPAADEATDDIQL